MTRRHLILVLALIAATIAPTAASGQTDVVEVTEPSLTEPLPGCAAPLHEGGDWATVGNGWTHTRNQTAETTIGPDEAAALAPAFTFTVDGGITSTPVIVDGCGYVATNHGYLYAFNADTGEQVWAVDTAALEGATWPEGTGQISGSVTVADGIVYASVPALESPGNPQEDGLYVVAVDQATGEQVFVSDRLDDVDPEDPSRFQGANIYTSPLVIDGSDDDVHDPVILVGVSNWGSESDFSYEGTIRYAQDGKFLLLDAQTGEELVETHTVAFDPDDDSAGCGVWATPAYDPELNVFFIATSNPHNPETEHAHCNAVLKVGADRTDAATFGQVIDSYKGTDDEYVSTVLEHHAGFEDYPCEGLGTGSSPTPSQEAGTCPDMDLAFGASPNVFTLDDGRRVVGAAQKSGHYHLFDAVTMERIWLDTLGLPTLVGGLVGTPAIDGTDIIGQHTAPGYMWSVDGATGTPNWVSAGGPVAYANPVSVANGVAYMSDQSFAFSAVDTTTGLPVGRYRLDEGTGATFEASATQGGIAIARNTIYVAVGTQGSSEGHVVAYRAGEGGTGVPGLPDPQGLPVPDEATPAVVAGPGAVTTGFLPPQVVVPQGSGAVFVNADNVAHNVAGEGFASDVIAGPGGTVPIEGVADLPAGDHPFICRLHPGMTGTLLVR